MNAQANDLRVAHNAAGNDAALWEAFKTGNSHFFSFIYQSHIQALYSYGMQVVKDPELVEDCIQDLFIYIWGNRHKLGQTNNIRFYLFKALRRRLAAKSKSKSREERCEDFLLHPTHIALSYEHTLIVAQMQQSQQAKLNRAMVYLTRRQREAIYLRFYDNLSFQEIAEVMALGLKSTYNLISRSLDILRTYLCSLRLVLLFLLGTY